MSAYTPADLRVVWALLAALPATLLFGLAISRIRNRIAARTAAWGLVVGSVLFAERITAAEPPGFRMLAIIGILLYAMKAVVSIESTPRLPPIKWLAFAALWPGMRPSLFQSAGGPRLEGAGKLIGMGLVRLVLGFALIISARFVWIATGSRAAATIPLLPGLSLVLHFGLFNILAGGWRWFGVDAAPLFKAPLLSNSLAEFWGRRWNLAFSEMTAAGVYRPISAIAGKPVGLVVAFAASGMLHELAISLPVKAGFGLPLSFFALHGVLMLIERALEKRGLPISNRAWLGRAWVILWLALPLPILFHPPFLKGVIWPLLGV